jgi:hypothetical protein
MLWSDYEPRQQWRGFFLPNDLGHQKVWWPSFFPLADLFVATQYEIPLKLSISTFHVSVMVSTPAIASHKARHPSPAQTSRCSWLPDKKLAAVTPRGAGGSEATELKSKCRGVNLVPKLSNASCPYAQVCVCAIWRCVFNEF